ncbi:MAG TPA: thiamine pyrophosphate-binding protein [Syntrophorhabdaceae bacterium]|nr:thiamine pyrophosphate-binding protein [Syntrophorhabdaceae bacterium]
MTGKQFITEFLLKNGVEFVFHLPGIHSLPLTSFLVQQDKITTVIPRHESDLAFMADGYARVSGKPGVLLITPGPGLGNILTGCMEAFNSDVPLLIMHVDVERADIPKGILHGLADPECIFQNVTKKTYRISKTNEMPGLLDAAYLQCTTGRTGPVLVSIPYSFFEKTVPENHAVHDLEPLSEALGESEPLSEFVERFEHLLQNKHRPVILAGRNAMTKRIGNILAGICSDKQIPLVTTTGGKGVLPDSDPHVFGNIMSRAANDIIASADIVVAAGTRLRDTEVRRRSVKIDELVHIDCDHQWLDRNYASKLTFAGDIEHALCAAENVMRSMTFSWDLQSLAQAQQKEKKSLEASPGFQIMTLLRNTVPENTTVVCDLNMISYWCEYYFPVFLQHSFIMPRGMSPIFYALPAGIGAKMGRPSNPCLAICGDGGILPTIAELSTMQQYKAPVVIFLYNNNSFGILEDIMSERYGIQHALNLRNPDFVSLARSFGIKAKRTRALQGLRQIFERDISWDEPFLIEFSGPVYEPPWRQRSK